MFVIILGMTVLALITKSKAEELLPDSWASQIEFVGNPNLVPRDKMSEFEAEFGARAQPRDGELEEGGELDPTGKPVDMEINNLPRE